MMVTLQVKDFDAAVDWYRDVLGLPILGHIPVIEAPSKGRKPKGAAAAMCSELCVAHDRKGTQAEAYRSIRTAVYFSAQADGLRVGESAGRVGVQAAPGSRVRVHS